MSYIDNRKLFIGGIGLSTTESTLYDYFSQFGAVSSCKIMLNTKTNKPRGFAFVTFEDQNSSNIVLSQTDHFLRGKRIDPKPAFAKDVPPVQQNIYEEPAYNYNGLIYEGETNNDPYYSYRRVFVGGIGNTTEKQLWDHFSEFGSVKTVSIMLHKTTRRPRGFAFIEFESYESAFRSISSRYQKISDKTIEVQIAVPKHMMENIKYSNNVVNNLLRNDSVSPTFENFSDQTGIKSVYRDKEDKRFFDCMSDNPKDILVPFQKNTGCLSDRRYRPNERARYTPGTFFFNQSDDLSEENSFSPKDMDQLVLDEFGFPDDTKSSIYEILDEILNGQ